MTFNTYREKIKYYCDLAIQTEKEAVASRNNWTSVLNTSAKMYKYSFADQLMIHAQYPDATACASYEMWNKSFNRWIKGGTKGIVLLDTSSGKPKLNYVFDVSGTQVYKENSRNVDLWQFKEEHEPLVLSQLAQIYDDVDTHNLSVFDNFHNIANQLATEYYEDNGREIRIRTENSFVEDYDDDNLRVAYIDSVSTSITYVLMKRCGYDVSEYFTDDDFDHIINFNSADALYAVGEAVSDLSEQVLRDVELVVKKHERQKANELALNQQISQTQNMEQERDVENERNNSQEQRNVTQKQRDTGELDGSSATNNGTTQRTDVGGEIRNGIHSGGGLSSAEPISIGGKGQRTSVGQIRTDEEGFSQTTSQNNIRNDEQQGNALYSLQGNRAVSGDEIGTSDEVANSQSPATQQRSRPDGLDGRNEYAETSSGRTDTERTDSRLHLNDNAIQENAENQDTEQVSTGYSQVGNTLSTVNIEPPQPSDKLTQLLSTSSITIDEVDSILRDGGNDRNSILRITAHFAKDLPNDVDAEYLRDEYLYGRYRHGEPTNGGKGFNFNGKNVSVWFDEVGIKIGRGNSALSVTNFAIIPWEQAAERVKQLYNTGLFVNHDVLEEALHNEYSETADTILNLYDGFGFRDLIEKPDNWRGEEVGWDGDRQKLTKLLKQYQEKDGGNGYMDVLNQVYNDLDKLGIDPIGGIISETSPLSAKNQKRAIDIFKRIEKLVIEPIGFQVADIPRLNATRFITDDEINNYLTKGSNFSESKMRVLSFFLNNLTPKERTDFLKNEYGHGGGTWLGVDDGWYDYTPSNGITLKRKDCENITLNWNVVAKRMNEIIQSGRFVSEQDLGRIPSYEKIILAREIKWFFDSLPFEDRELARNSAEPSLSPYVSPFADEVDFHYPKQEDWDTLNTFLENEPSADGVRPIDACLEKMNYIVANTSEEDRHYNSRKKNLENLTAFRDGTYTLFPNLDKHKNAANLNAILTSNVQKTSINNIPFKEFAPSQQITLFESAFFPQIPSVVEQQAIIEKANEPFKPTVASEEVKNKELVSELTTDDITKMPSSDTISETAASLNNETPLDFNVVAEWFLESVLNDNRYLEEMAVAKSRSSLRSACSSALESIINKHEHEWNDVYQSYYNDDEFNDKLFDYILRKSWEHQQDLENEQTQIGSEPKKQYDINYGHLGNGLTVWNRLEEKNGDYVTVAHIAPDRTITFYDNEMPDNIKAKIETIARTSDARILRTQQDQHVFDTPPENLEAVQETENVAEIEVQKTNEIAGIHLTGAMINTFSKDTGLIYANDDNGNLYISNGYYVFKSAENDLGVIMEQINRRKKTNTIEAKESNGILNAIEMAKGNFELTTDPHVLSKGNGLESYVYADNKQYFQYNKQFIDAFQFADASMFIDDASSYDINDHRLIVKDNNGGVLGVILPVKTDVILYEQLADILPLETPYKTEIERAKENLAKFEQSDESADPFIGREFFDGNETHFVSNLNNTSGENKYLVPTISYDENGGNPSLSSHALLIKPTDMDSQIKRWENSRIYAEQQNVANEIKTQQEAVEKAIYENTNGYADNLPQLQKARTLKVLNDHFYTKDYGNIRLKQFIETAVSNGNTLEIVNPMKKKFREMDASEYFDTVGSTRGDIEARSNYNKATRDYDRDSKNSQWLKENHPFLHYEIFREESVLDSTFFNTEYRLYIDDSRFYEVNKTAYDYGNYLIDSGALDRQESSIDDSNDLENNDNNEETVDKPEVDGSDFATDIPVNEPVSVNFKRQEESEQLEEQEKNKLPKPSNFRINNDNLGHGGAKTKFRANVEAIKTLHAIESENRYATPEEQEILSHYVGWGGLQEAFDETKEQWANEFAELSLLLTDDEYKSARESVLNAHYTSPTVIKAIYDAVERMGFKTGNLLEPSVGVGNFFGLLSKSMGNAKLYGVELDSISARLAKQLYPNATIKEMGYEKTDYPDNFFDISVGNVPFGDYGVIDKKYDKHKLKIHDYFFAKTLDQVRPGGVIAFVTSKGTLDKTNHDVRKYLAQRAELLGAVRLPNTAFKANAGTEVTSDIIFLQKRDRIIDIDSQDSKFDWVHLGQIDDAKVPDKQISINRYFIDNPEMVLGEMTADSGSRMYGAANMTACVPFETMPDGSPAPSLSEQLQKVMLNIKGQISTPEVSIDIDDLDGSSLEAIPTDPNVRNFSFTVIDDIVYFRENSMMYPVEQPATTLERIKGMVGLRDCVRELIRIQVDEYDEYVGEVGDKLIKDKQAELEVLYNKFNKDFGHINDSANNRAFATGQFSDNAYYLLCSLEVFDEDGNFKRKGDMFTKRTIKQKTVITHVDTSTEALAVSMGEKAKVDIEYMAHLTGFTPEKIMQDLKGVIYCDITNPNRAIEPFDPAKMKIYKKYPLVTADEFLSGDIRKKLVKAKMFHEIMPDEIHNIDVAFSIETLESAMPKDLEAHEINFRLGSTWIDPKYVQEFMYETFQTSPYNKDTYQVKYHSASGEWNVTGKGRAAFGDIPATVTYGTKRANAYEILCDTLNLKDVRVYDYFTDENGNKTRELNKKETAISQQKQEQIKSLFKDWLFKDPERRQILVKLYNEKFNSTRPREYDGSHINFSGISPEIKLREHQLNAIAHILYGGNTLLAHEVGAGKTFEIVAAAMESKRLGLTNKSLIAVPNHLTEQWGSEWLRLYPSANILVATKKDFEPRNRKKFIAKIATGDYDAVIIGHTQLEKIPLSNERQERILQEQLDEIIIGIEEVEASKGDRFTIKQMERTRKSIELKMQKLLIVKSVIMWLRSRN